METQPATAGEVTSEAPRAQASIEQLEEELDMVRRRATLQLQRLQEATKLEEEAERCQQSAATGKEQESQERAMPLQPPQEVPIKIDERSRQWRELEEEAEREFEKLGLDLGSGRHEEAPIPPQREGEAEDRDQEEVQASLQLNSNTRRNSFLGALKRSNTEYY